VANRRGGVGFESEVTGTRWSGRNRVLASDLGRWVQRDSLEYADGLGLYVYARSSPLVESDPLGLSCNPCKADKAKNITPSSGPCHFVITVTHEDTHDAACVPHNGNCRPLQGDFCSYTVYWTTSGDCSGTVDGYDADPAHPTYHFGRVGGNADFTIREECGGTWSATITAGNLTERATMTIQVTCGKCKTNVTPPPPPPC